MTANDHFFCGVPFRCRGLRFLFALAALFCCARLPLKAASIEFPNGYRLHYSPKDSKKTVEIHSLLLRIKSGVGLSFLDAGLRQYLASCFVNRTAQGDFFLELRFQDENGNALPLARLFAGMVIFQDLTKEENELFSRLANSEVSDDVYRQKASSCRLGVESVVTDKLLLKADDNSVDNMQLIQSSELSFISVIHD